MSKEMDNYEEQVWKEFESTQSDNEQSNKKSEPTPVKDLGKVNLGGIDINDDPDIRRVNSTMGYIDIPLDTLPSMGRFYPENTRISIRAAKVNEIREFSIIDESNPSDIRDKMNYILSQCVKVYYGNSIGHYRDIIEDDRIPLILKVRELTFVEGQSSIKIPVPEDACSTPGCHPQETVDFSSNKLVFQTPGERIERYYDSVERCYNVQTKSYGIIRLNPPTVGVTSIVAEWVTEQQRENKKFDIALADLVPYVVKDWRTFSKKQVFAKITEMAGWSIEKFSLVLGLKDDIKTGIEFEIVETCAQCGGELRIPVTFPGGLKSIFVPSISDFGGELL